jgi:hypothetical protein
MMLFEPLAQSGENRSWSRREQSVREPDECMESGLASSQAEGGKGHEQAVKGVVLAGVV